MSVANHAIASLKTAIRSALLADADVSALVGTAIHDSPPRGLAPPYVTFGDVAARDNGTNDNRGLIIDLDLVAFAAERGTEMTLGIVAAIEQALTDSNLVLVDHHLAALEIRQGVLRFDAAAELARGTLRLRAFTEPLT